MLLSVVSMSFGRILESVTTKVRVLDVLELLMFHLFLCFRCSRMFDVLPICLLHSKMQITGCTICFGCSI